MTLIQPRAPAGVMEPLPREQRAFQHMLDVIRRGYELFGFTPLQTTALELVDVLLNKSGGETEKQVYFLQSTGSLRQGDAPDMALNFDLTVPLARYVAEHERNLAFPFRRYQIQRSYRGERPQKGRFREFYQCDIDVIGKDKLDPLYDAELPAIVVGIFTELQVGAFTILFSNRKVLMGLLAGMGVDDPTTRKLALREVDKIDKIGQAKAQENIVALGLGADKAARLMGLVAFEGDKDAILARLEAEETQNPIFREGVAELKAMVAALRALGVPEERTRIDLSIARGLDYYTGTVYETRIDAHPEFGSVCSGGRYEDLAGLYTKSKLPGVGISIGATRLFDLLSSAGLIAVTPPCVDVLITQLEPARCAEYLALAALLRREGLKVESYLEPAKLDKQLKYADKAGVPLVVMMGGNEAAAGTVMLKDLTRKTQEEVKREALAARIKEILSV